MELSKADREKVEAEIAKQLKEDGKVAELLKKNQGKLAKAGFDIKVTAWIDPSTKEKKMGGTIELYETESKSKLLDGINIDLGATNDLHIMLGLSKDFELTEEREFSIGGYIDATDIGEQIATNIKDKKNNDIDVRVKLGISKTF
jgi:hypothetical protein